MLQILAFPLELILGALIGFLMSNGIPGFTWEDLKYSTIAFGVVAGMTYLFAPTALGQFAAMNQFVFLTVGWLVTSMGVMAGEQIRLSLIRRAGTVNSARGHIIELMQRATRYATYPSEAGKLELQERLDQIQVELDGLIRRQTGSSRNHLESLRTICERYVNLTIILAAGCQLGEVYPLWQESGDTLLSLACQALESAEGTMMHQAATTPSVRLLAMSMRRL